MTKHFLTFKQFYFRAFRSVQSLSDEIFDDLLKQLCHLITNKKFLMTCDSHLWRGDYRKKVVHISTNQSAANQIAAFAIVYE